MTSYPKGSLVRLVAREGKPTLDFSGRAAGRGAYLCRNEECLEKAMKRKNVFSSLGISMAAAEKDSFRTQFAKACAGKEVKEC
jgi:predicted RNA-binding protein YlxR (DUF448 family)